MILVSLVLSAAGCYQSGGVDERMLAGSGAPAPSAHACPTGCGLGLHLQLPPVRPYERYENAQLEVCHNDSCIDGRVEVRLNTIFAIKRIYEGRLPDGMTVAISVDNSPLGGAIDLQLHGSDPMKLRDGDRYVFKVTAADGETLHDFDGNVHYEHAAAGCSMCPFEEQLTSPVFGIPTGVEGRSRD
jgi:hypothetical protein